MGPEKSKEVLNAATEAQVDAINKRVRMFIDYKKYSMHTFGEMVGIAAGGISRAINPEGKYSMGIDKYLKMFIVFPELNPHWLLFGEGSMVITEEYDTRPESVKGLKVEIEQLRSENQRLTHKQEAYQEILSLLGSNINLP
ncbi:MAG TPA: hypothetical protein DCE41_15850 [Cytophagales bacterium]|nr:hypothetical protein [Cytophagales bacterium]